MPRVTKAQAEIEGTESPARNECRRKEATAEESDKRQQAGGILHALGIEKYHVDGIELWLEPGKEKVKVHLDSDEEEA